MSTAAEMRRPTGATHGVEAGVQLAAGRRFFDATADAWMVKVFPGEFYVSGKADEVLITVLGSCVSACIRDPLLGIGGMNHFMLPQSHSGKWGSDPEPTRFGNFAMEKLLNELIKAGASRERMEIKVFGGGNVTDSTQAIGTKNAEFVLRYLEDEGLRWAAQDLGRSPAPHSLLSENRSRHPPAAGQQRVRHDRARRIRLCEPPVVAQDIGRHSALWGRLMTSMSSPVRVLIVDDLALMRQLLTTLLAEDPEIEVVGTAPDPHVARERIKALNPDVITLDVEMPHMDGVTFLRKIMALRPMPVVMISTLTQAGAEVTLEALEAGAVDFIAKPSHDVMNTMGSLATELQEKVKAAARTRIGARRAAPPLPKPRERLGRATGKIVLIGASTGGVEALKALLMGLPADCPPVLITQHMPARFTSAFANRLNKECPMTVSEAVHNEEVQPGHVYIAPGSHHMELVRVGSRYACALNEGPPVSGHRPSVDVLFRSGARTIASAGIGVILTGMGKDGAEGMLDFRRAGAATLGQDEELSLIYGMPRAAFERGAVMRQYPLMQLADAILEACDGSTTTRGATGSSRLARTG